MAGILRRLAATAAAARRGAKAVMGVVEASAAGGTRAGGVPARLRNSPLLSGPEAQVDEVVRILSPGPLASASPPVTAAELQAAKEAVTKAKEAWSARQSASDALMDALHGGWGRKGDRVAA